MSKKCKESEVSKNLLADDHDVNKNIKKKYNEELCNADISFLLVIQFFPLVSLYRNGV